MAHQATEHGTGGTVGRRALLKAAGAMAGAAALAPAAALAQEDRDYGPGAPPVHYPDPDVVAITPAFQPYIQGNSAIQRLWTGGLWVEGPAWNGVGRYLLWSDIPNNRQLRWLEDDGHVSVFRNPSGNSNGNTFDWGGRQISCEHGNRRVVRYEHDGSTTTLAETFEGRPFNSPNDAVVHPNGGIWFTDPPYGTAAVGGYEGNFGELHHPNAVYRIDPTGRIDRVTDELVAPNGLCFSHDYTRLYIADTGEGARDIKVFDVVDAMRLANGRQFTDMMIDGESVGPDAVRADIDGNIWASGGWVGYGYDGVHCFTPEGERIGHIRLPETTSNLVFGGPKRNRLMMTASQSIYAVYVNTRGAHIT
ncbi:MAG: SMP-30/gluconolactonase/LRE family protein [Chloroflexota bacterium]|nr:SMP-30/gluconolactonase/LRE family protein [Chloroflexota bacterium]